MSTKKCLWDESHEFEVKENEEYKVLCPKCYYDIFTKSYSKTYSWYDFVKNIKLFKMLHQLNGMIDDNSEFKNQYDLISKQIQGVEKTCLMCGDIFHTGKDEDFRYLCSDCYKKFYLPLKEYYSVKEIEAILTNIKKEGGDMVADLEKAIQKVKEKN